jgi:putative transposase
MARKRCPPEQIITMLRDEAKVLVEAWRKTYNRIRPHSSLGYRPPAPEAHVVGKFTLGLAPC